MVFVDNFGNFFVIDFDDELDDGKIVLGVKLGVIYVDIKKGV